MSEFRLVVESPDHDCFLRNPDIAGAQYPDLAGAQCLSPLPVYQKQEMIHSLAQAAALGSSDCLVYG